MDKYLGREKKYVLIADDDRQNLKLFGSILRNEDYEVVLVEDSHEIFDLTREYKPDLIMLDISMPGLNGYEACRLLKNDVETMDIPLIFVSALFEERDKMQAFDCGAVDYIVKPILPKELKARVQVHINLRQKIEELEIFNRTMVEREMRIIELKQEVNALSAELGRALPYPEIWGDEYSDEAG